MWSVVTTSAVRPRPPGQDQPGPSDDARAGLAGSLAFAGARAAGASAGAGLAAMTMLALAGWIAAPHPGLGLGGVLRTAGVLWLVGHHVAVQVQGAGRIGMLPLGLVLLPGTLLFWAGRAVVRGQRASGGGQVAAAALAVAVPYSVIAGVLAIVSRSELAKASFPQAVMAGFAVAFIAAWLGAARALAPWAKVGTLMSDRARSILLGAAGSFAVLVAAGMLTTAVALANHVHQFGAVYDRLGPGLVGSVLLLLAQLAYLPNAVLWAIAYMVGPGFAVGAGTIVAPTGSVLGAMPAFPLLAALPGGPHDSVPGWLAAVLLSIPYLAGVTGGLLIVRHVPHATVDGVAIRGFCGGAASGVLIGLLAAFAGGPLGDGRLSAVGPSAWQVMVVAALELGIAAAVSAGAGQWWYRRRRAYPDADEIGAISVQVPEAAATRQAPGWSAEPDEGGHVIYLDRWAEDQEAGNRPKRSRGPSALP